MKWNGVFIDFFCQISRWNLILVIGSKFGSNSTIRSSYSHWKHFLVVGSSQIWFSTIGSQIWQLDALTKTRVKFGSLDLQKFKYDHWMQGRRRKKSPKKLPINWYFLAPLLLNAHIVSSSIFLLIVSLQPIFYRYFDNFFSIFLLTNYRWLILFRPPPILDFSVKKTKFSNTGHKGLPSLISLYVHYIKWIWVTTLKQHLES